MTDILDLKGWTVLGRTEEDGADVLEAEYPQPMPTGSPYRPQEDQPVGLARPSL